MSAPSAAPPATMRELLAWCAEHDGVTDPGWTALTAAVLRQHEQDRARFSDVLEPSVSWDGRAARCCRFSYAFPGFAADPARVGAALRGLLAPFGPAVADAATRLCKAATSACAAQPLVGFADDGGGQRRLKLYLQFHDAAGASAFAVAAALLGRDARPALPPDSALHLVGIDLSTAGAVTGAKLYLLRDRLAPDDPLVAGLGLGRALVRPLVIHRLAHPGDPALAIPAELDFALFENDLAWPDLRTRLPGAAALAPLEAAFALRIRRVSVPVPAPAPRAKLNVYYVPA